MRVVRRTDDDTSRTGGDRRPETRGPLRLVRPGDTRADRSGEKPALRDIATPAEHGRQADAPRRDANPPRETPVDEVRAARVRESQQNSRAWEVRAETAAAAAIPAHDARWVTAARASQAIEGGRAAVLRPEVRARLVTSAERMGLRPFDANLVLAIVQDAARQGHTIQDADTIDRLALVRGREPTPRRRGVFVALCLGLSAMWALLLIWWLRG